MIAISFTLGLRQRPATTTAWHLRTVIIPSAQLPAGLCADRFGGATTAVTGCTKNLSRRGRRRERLAGACDDEDRRTPRALRWWRCGIGGLLKQFPRPLSQSQLRALDNLAGARRLHPLLADTLVPFGT
jgi:hypothetical protein